MGSLKYRTIRFIRSTSRLTRLGAVVLMIAGAGMFLSDSGVRADDGAESIKLPGPAKGAKKFPEARVLRLDDRGWLQVTRDQEERLGVVTVMTGFDCQPGDEICSALERGEFVDSVKRFRDRAAAGLDDVRTRRGLASALYLQGDLTGAVRAYSWASSGYPTDVDVRNGLGVALLELGVVTQAAEEFQALLADPQYRLYQAAALNNLGNALRAANRFEQADDEYRRALQADPDLVAAHYNRGITLMDLDRHAEAASAFRNVTRRLPDLTDGYLNEGLALLRAKEPIRAAVALHRARDLSPDNPAVNLALGLASHEVGLDEQAVVLFRHTLEHSERDERILQLLAASLIRTGRLQQAADRLEQAFELKPRDAEEHFQQGLKLFLCDRPEEAGVHFLQAMARGRRDADAFFALGQVLLQTGRSEDAVKALSVVSRMKPSAAEVHFSLGMALQQTDDTAGAIREIKTAVALDPTDTDIQVVLMGIQMRSGDFTGCARVGRQLIMRHPDLVGPRFDIALCQALAGDLDRAAENLTDALDHDIDGIEVHPLWRRAEHLVRTGTDEPGAYLLLAMIHERRGNWSQAVQAYEGFILARPDSEWITRALVRIHRLSPEPVLEGP